MYKVFFGDKTFHVEDNEWADFSAKYAIVEAAGGLVQNPKGEVLMIFRQGFWDLPKGKLESCETTDRCAIREVEEECSITGIKIQRLLTTTYHIYKQNDIKYLKKTHWYLMNCDNSNTPTPQAEEGIEIAEWSNPDKVKENLKHSYNSIGEVFKLNC
ncbi:MAG: NUDIX domain-containing protein [Prevotellaceae bacterium]|jgi:ADP-ribose pyrophosphatase YjhB (NUDIX family)|nr:NUDIX domain-containing protein [Prevotellaceae bacterium]